MARAGCWFGGLLALASLGSGLPLGGGRWRPGGFAAQHRWRAGPRRATADPEITSFRQLVDRLIAAEDPVWELLQFESAAMEALADAKDVHSDVVKAQRKEDVIIRRIVQDLETPFLSATQLQIIFQDLVLASPALAELLALDLLATALCGDVHLIEGLDSSKGLHAVFTYRFYHELQNIGRACIARFLQSQNSEVFMADIHPAARIGSSFFIGSASGVVIGETAIVGDGVAMAHFVTLGGNGKDVGDRHPKVANSVFLGAGAQIIGNIQVGEGAVVMAKSVVVKPVPPFSKVAGVPAKVTGRYECEIRSQQQEDEKADGQRRVYYTHQPML